MWRVLVVDDELEMQRKVIQGLSKVAVCAGVCSGREAIRIYKESIKSRKPFDFILLDVWMPEMDGFEVVKILREEEQKADDESVQEARIIMITSYAEPMMDKINMGWDDFITKPVEPDKLIKHMERLISKQTYE